MKKFLRLLPFIGLFLFAVFFTQKLFVKDYIIYGEEQGFINYDYVNYRHTGLWDPTHNFGSISPFVFNRFTVGPFWAIGNKIGLEGATIEKIYFFTIIFLTILFSYILFKKLGKSTHVAFLTSIIYVTVFNYFVSILTSPKFMHYLILPASVYLWLKYEETGKPRYILFNCIMLLFSLVIVINPPQMLGAYSFIFLFILLFSYKTAWIKKAFYLSTYLAIIVFVLLTNFLVIFNNQDLSTVDTFNLNWSASSSELYDIYRLFGAWWDYAGLAGINYNQLGPYYHSSIGIIFTYIPFMTVLFLLIAIKNSLQLKAKLIALILIFLFVTKGDHPPIGDLFTFLFKIPILRIFREPWAKFMPNLIFSLILCIVFLHQYLSEKTKKFVYVLLYIMVIFQLIPIIKGDALDHRVQDWKVADVRIPQYWKDLSTWTYKNAQNKRILVFPYIPEGEERPEFTWKPLHFFGNTTEFLLYSQVISGIATDSVDQAFLPSYFLHLNSNLLAASSVDYVLNMKDVKPRGNKVITLQSVSSALDKQNILQFGPLDLYPLKKEYHSGQIRSISTVHLTDNPCDIEGMASTNSSRNVLLLQSDSKLPPIAAVPISVIKLDNWRYRIRIPNNISREVGILFAQRYNRGWKLYGSHALTAKPLISDSRHRVGNCFMNYWQIPKEVAQETNTFYLEYQPQKQFIVLLSIFFATLGTIVTGAYAYYFIRMKDEK